MTGRAVIAYWGPGLSGKSTNLCVVREVLAGHARDERAPSQLIEAAPDRVLFDLGAEGAQLELFAPPGQAHHRLLRQEAFADVDGVVFVADSSASAVSVNLAALEELELLVGSRDLELCELPLVFQFNKRDLCDALEVSRLQELLNSSGRPSVEAIATRGVGVFPSLKAVARELKRCGPTARAKTAGGSGRVHIEEEEDQLLGAVLGGEEVALDTPMSCGGSGRAEGTGSPRGTSSWLVRWPLALAGVIGAFLREVLELGWRFAAGGG